LSDFNHILFVASKVFLGHEEQACTAKVLAARLRVEVGVAVNIQSFKFFKVTIQSFEFFKVTIQSFEFLKVTKIGDVVTIQSFESHEIGAERALLPRHFLSTLITAVTQQSQKSYLFFDTVESRLSPSFFHKSFEVGRSDNDATATK
jgi:hypothetical protein